MVKTEIKLLIRNQKPRGDFKIISINYQPLEIMFFYYYQSFKFKWKETHKLICTILPIYYYIITLLPFFIQMLQYDWL